MKKIALMLFLQFVGVWLFAITNEPPGTFQITGRVTDESGNPLIGATVTIENSLLGTTSNLYGSYTLKKLKPKVYTISVTFIGYEKRSVAVKLENDLVLDFTLKPLSIMGEEIVVNATRASSRMPIAQTTLSKEEIKKASTGFDIPFLLEMIPSVVATSESGTGIGNTAFRIRGTDMSRINVTVNGIPLNDPESQGVYWVDLPDFAASVDNVQVQRGIGTSTNGAAAFGASVNFQTSTLTPEPFTKIDLMSGSFGTWKTSAIVGTGIINKSFSFEGRYSQLKSDGYIDRGNSNHHSMFFTSAWHTAKSLLRFNFIYGEEHTGITWTGNPGYMLDSIRTYNPEGIYTDTSGKTRYYRDQKDNYIQTHYQLMYSRQLTSYLNLSAALHLTKGAGYYEEYKDNTVFTDYGINDPKYANDTTDLIRQKWLDNNFYGTTLSLNYCQGIIDATFGGGWNRYDGDHFGRILWSAVNNGIPKGYEWYNNNGLKTDFNIYGKSNIQITERLSLYADIQYRTITFKMKGPDDDLIILNQHYKWNFFNPKFGGIFKLSSNQQVFASFGVGNREPSRTDLKEAIKKTIVVTPKSERLLDYEFGYSYKSSRMAVGLNLYYMDYKDQLVLTGKVNDVGYPLMMNVPKSYRAGIEFFGQLKPNHRVSWDGSLTLSRNKITNFTEYVDLYDNSTSWNPLGQKENFLGTTDISYSPSVVGSSQFRVEPLNGLSVSFISKYVSSQYFDNSSSRARMINSYFVNNLRLDYQIKYKNTKQVNLEINVNNIFNNLYESNAYVWYRAAFDNNEKEYLDDRYFPQAGINFMVKLGVEF
jgi:iron complex outermembrane recepter protein